MNIKVSESKQTLNRREPDPSRRNTALTVQNYAQNTERHIEYGRIKIPVIDRSAHPVGGILSVGFL